VSHFLKNYYGTAPQEIQMHVGMAAYYARMAEMVIETRGQRATPDLIRDINKEFPPDAFDFMTKGDKNAYFNRPDINFDPITTFLRQQKDIPLALTEEQKGRALVSILKKHHWLEEDILHHTPNVSSHETVSYFGNVKPTSLYGQIGDHGKSFNYILPMAPYVHMYMPELYFGYTHVAYALKPTQKIRDFFGKQDIRQYYLVVQGLQGEPNNQLLRLHGFIHGKQAKYINKSINVTAEILPIKNEAPITFSNDGVNQTSGVHCHDGVASPNNFALKGWKGGIFDAGWQAFGVYLHESHTATLIIVGQKFIKEHESERAGQPLLTPEAAVYLDTLLS
jgi:hypothetical protein